MLLTKTSAKDRYKILQNRGACSGVYQSSVLTRLILMSKKTKQPHWAAAVFQNAAFSIEVRRQTTFAQLAEALNALAEIHGRLVCPVQVRVGAPLTLRNQAGRQIAQ
jgi:hypothetical protein